MDVYFECAECGTKGVVIEGERADCPQCGSEWKKIPSEAFWGVIGEDAMPFDTD